MSVYIFIAADYELPEVDNSKERTITVAEAINLGIMQHELVPWENENLDAKILYFENESDLGELIIKRDTRFPIDVELHTKKPFIYEVSFRYTEARAEQLLAYLKENIKPGTQLELWSIWLDDEEEYKIKPTLYQYDDFVLRNIKQMFDFRSETYRQRIAYVIRR